MREPRTWRVRGMASEVVLLEAEFLGGGLSQVGIPRGGVKDADLRISPSRKACRGAVGGWASGIAAKTELQP